MQGLKSHFPIHIPNAADMVSFGEKIGPYFIRGDVIALVGQLGAGKTHLAKGIAQSFNYEGAVTSPSYALIHEYSRTPLVHADLYRMNRPEELLEIGWDEYLDNDLVLIVEWADRFPQLMPEKTHWIKIQHRDRGRALEYALH